MISNSEEVLIGNLEFLGVTAFDDYWRGKKLLSLENNWWAALVFALDHIFFQGRRDTLSQRYRNHAVAVLRNQLHLTRTADDSEICPDDGYERLRKKINAQPPGALDNLSTDCECEVPLNELDSSLPLLDQLCPHLTKHKKGLPKALHDGFVKEHGTSDISDAAIRELDRLPLNKKSDVLMLTESLSFVAKKDNHKNVFKFLRTSSSSCKSTSTSENSKKHMICLQICTG